MNELTINNTELTERASGLQKTWLNSLKRLFNKYYNF